MKARRASIYSTNSTSIGGAGETNCRNPGASSSAHVNWPSLTSKNSVFGKAANKAHKLCFLDFRFLVYLLHDNPSFRMIFYGLYILIYD